MQVVKEVRAGESICVRICAVEGGRRAKDCSHVSWRESRWFRGCRGRLMYNGTIVTAIQGGRSNVCLGEVR